MPVCNDKNQESGCPGKPAWVEPAVIQIDQLPTTFGACSKGTSEVPGDTTNCTKGKQAALVCNKGANG